VAQPQEPYKRIGVQDAKQLIDSGKVRLVDVREPNEWADGHIAQATHVPVGTLINSPEKYLPTDNLDQPYMFVCAAGVRSAVACEVAAMLGFKEVYNLEGGTGEWIKAGNPVTR
jgi:rhodanese-related sulfurtransferase